MTKGEQVVRVALAEVGVREVPVNTGPRVREYQAATDLGGTGWPWCAAFVEWCWKRVPGISTGICSASTAVFADRARASGLTGAPRPGAAFIIYGVHTGLLVAPAGGSRWYTVEGNAGDMVARRVRDISGCVIAVPKELRDTPLRPKQYWFEDRGAKKSQRLIGPWRGKRGLAKARAVAKKQPRALQPRVKRVGPNRFGVLVGQRSLYGPWASADSRDAALRVIAKRTGRTMRPYSTLAPITTAEADSLGKTT